MEIRPNKFLLVGAGLSGIASLLHVGCIIFGGSWYRFLGAGEQMAQMSEQGHWYPVVVTSFIALVLAIWSLYALSGAGVIRKLPLLRLGLCVITGIYLLRGFLFVPFAEYFPGNSLSFWLWSSAICLIIGIVYAVGVKQTWGYLGSSRA